MSTQQAKSSNVSSVLDTPLSGKSIVLYAEGGFGDTIQFIRYAKLFDPDVKLIIQCQLPLIELIRGMRLGAEVIAPGDTPPPHDFHCPLMSLPLALADMPETKILVFASFKLIRCSYKSPVPCPTISSLFLQFNRWTPSAAKNKVTS